MSELAQESERRALTGVRPTGDLTIANYLGAIQPIAEMQETFDGDINVFVADIHGLTDQEPSTVRGNILGSVRSLVAAGIDPNRSTVFLQSQIEDKTVWLAHMLDRHTTPAELRRIPTLKEKLRDDGSEDNVNMSLFRYPVLMAADIAIQRATDVMVGDDQMPHIEFARRLIRRFNQMYGAGKEVLAVPQGLGHKTLRIIALQEKDGKMSKSKPSSAILLRDKPDDVSWKIKKAQTAAPGEMPTILESHFTMAELLSSNNEERSEVKRLKAAHMAGETVMGNFKTLLTDVTNNFLSGFHERYESVSESDAKTILLSGAEKIKQETDSTVERAKLALGLTSVI